MNNKFRINFLGVPLDVDATVTGDIKGEFEVEVNKISTLSGDNLGELIACGYVKKATGYYIPMDDVIDRILRDRIIGER